VTAVPALSILVLGSGFWGTEWLRVLAAADGIAIAGTAGGRDPQIPHGAPLAAGYAHHRDYEDAIGQVEADAVVIALPTRLHADAILRALAAGRHVLCEKPLANDAEETARLLDAAGRRPELVAMVGQNYRRRPWAEVVRSEIAAGRVGDIGHVAVRFRQPEMPLGARAELDNPLLQDMGIHHFDLIRFLTGRDAVELYARQHRPAWSEFRGSPGLDAIIVMEDGLQVSYSGSWAGRGRATAWDADWLIEGDRGLLAVTDLEVTFFPSVPNDPSTTETPVCEAEPIAVPELPTGDLEATFARFRQAIESGEEPETSLRDNSHSIALVFAAEEAIRLGRPVPVQTWPDRAAAAP
jgi:predicted dehydrogenase